MKRALIGLVLAATSAPAMAGEQNAAEKRGVAYEQCIFLAAVRASYTPIAGEQIYPTARAACAAARDEALGRFAGKPAMLAAFNAAEAHRASNLAGWVDGLRERRRLADALYGTPSR